MKSFYSDFGTKETVDCMINGENFTAFAACGDNNIHHVDLEYGKVKHAFSGHTDFIHSMSLRLNGQFRCKFTPSIEFN